MNCKTVAIFLFLTLVGPARATVKNLGTVGATYPVVEPDIAVEMQRDATARNGEIHAKIKKEMETYRPPDLQKLPKAKHDRTFLVDMTYTLKEDVKDGDGKVIYPRGFTFNSLDYAPFDRFLMIIDGSDQGQIEWFKKTPYADNIRVMLLISDGYAQKLSKQLKRPVFYLTEKIASRLHLAAVPSLVRQKGRMMEVREYLVEKTK